MSWSEVKKINSDLAKPLDTCVKEQSQIIQDKMSQDYDKMYKYQDNIIYNIDTVYQRVKTVNTNLNNLANSSQNGGVKIVKSVQKGIFTVNNAVTVPISPVDANKSILLIRGGENTYGGEVTSFSGSSFSVGGVSTQCNCFWQVVEFY